MLATISGMRLRTSFSRACAIRSSLSAAKPTQNGGAGKRGDASARMSGFSTSSKVGAPLPRRLLDLLRRRRRRRASRRPPRWRRRRRSSRRRGQHRGVHLLRRRRRRCGARRAASAERTGPATSVTSAPASARRARDREAHLAARPVGQAAHRIDRLEGRPGGDEHALRPASALRLEEGDQLGEQLGRLEHAAVADLAAGLVAAAGAEHGGAVGAQLRDVALRRRMRPHLAVHRRRDEQRAALDRPRQAQQREQVVGAARAAAWR